MGTFAPLIKQAIIARNLLDAFIITAIQLENLQPTIPDSKPSAPDTPVPMPIPVPDSIPIPTPDPIQPEPTPIPDPIPVPVPDPVPNDLPPIPEPIPIPVPPVEPEMPEFPIGNIVVKDIKYLHPKIQPFLEEAISQCSSNGYAITLTETYRTPERQDFLYAQGRTTAGDIVTNARGMESMHNYGLAVDIMVNKNFLVKDEVGCIFENLGFEWGAKWKSIQDFPHFQMTFNLKLSDLKKIHSESGLSGVWSSIGS